MKTRTVLLVGSFVANAALLAAFAFRPTLAPPQLRSYFGAASDASAKVAPDSASPKTSASDGQHSRPAGAPTPETLWTKLQSDDLRTLVQKLKAAGFPPGVIRAVVSAELQKRFVPRLNALMASSVATEFWKGDGNYFSSATTKLNEERNKIYRERARMMRDVLGDEIFATESAEVTDFMRRQYGSLSKPKIDLVQRIVEDYSEMASDVRNAARGMVLPEDRAKLALLEREKQADLAAILTPEELEEYEMRTSRITSRLREPLTLMNATEQEFRTIYAIQKKYADQLDPTQGIGGMYTTGAYERQREAEAKVQEEIAAALGAERGLEFARATNYDYRQLVTLAQRNNIPTSAAAQAFDLRASTAEQSVRIGEDTTLTADQKHAALQALAQDTRAKLISTLGPVAGQEYGKSASWLQAIERGSMVRFRGSSTTFTTVSSVPRPRN